MLTPAKDYSNKKIDNIFVINIDTAVALVKDKKCAVVTGVTGQDGSHMVDFLLKNTDLEVLGCVRRLSVNNHTNLKHINNSRFHLINFDLTDSHSICRLVERIKPAYFINLAAQSFVGSSWDFALQTWETNTTSVLNILEAIRLYNPSCRFYQAGSSEEFGDVQYAPQDENHPLRPRSPYGASKAAARQLVKVYRESYNLYAIQGWLFNHEGTRRGEEFVTRKITDSVAKIKLGKLDVLELGNLDAKRDWGFAKEYVEGMWRMLQVDEPDTFVLATNRTETVRDFVRMAFKGAGIAVNFKGSEEKEIAVDTATGKTVLRINPKFYRPAEVELLIGDPAKAKAKLGWEPKTTLEELCQMMVEADLRRNQAGFSF